MAYIDPTQSSPNNYKLLFEDDTHRVLEMTLPAGTKDNEHSHTSELVYFISGGSAHISMPGGESMDAGHPGRARHGPRGLDTHGREHRKQGYQGDHLRRKVAVDGHTCDGPPLSGN